jgi:hypothetical protein
MVKTKRHKNKKLRVKKRQSRNKKRYQKSKKRGGVKLPFRVGAFLPTCEREYLSQVENKYADYGGVKSILLELQNRGPPMVKDSNEAVKIARYLYDNCYILRDYMKFWDQAQDKIIVQYNLGPQVKGKRRIVDFIIKMYYSEPLSPELSAIWKTINTSQVSTPSQIIRQSPVSSKDPAPTAKL